MPRFLLGEATLLITLVTESTGEGQLLLFHTYILGIGVCKLEQKTLTLLVSIILRSVLKNICAEQSRASPFATSDGELRS